MFATTVTRPKGTSKETKSIDTKQNTTLSSHHTVLSSHKVELSQAQDGEKYTPMEYGVKGSNKIQNEIIIDDTNCNLSSHHKQGRKRKREDNTRPSSQSSSSLSATCILSACKESTSSEASTPLKNVFKMQNQRKTSKGQIQTFKGERKSYIPTVWIRDDTFSRQKKCYDILLDSSTNLSPLDIPKYKSYSERNSYQGTALNNGEQYKFTLKNYVHIHPNRYDNTNTSNDLSMSSETPARYFSTYSIDSSTVNHFSENDVPTTSGKIFSHDITASASNFTYSNEFVSFNNSIKDYSTMKEESNAQKLREKLIQDPTNISSWIAYIDLQEKLCKLQDIKRVAIVRKKIAIANQALNVNPENTSLLLLILQFAEELTDWSHLYTIWNRIMLQDKNRSIPDFWIAYIQFLKGNLKYVSVSIIRDAYKRALRSLSQVILRELDLARKGQLEASILSILYSYSLFEKEAGYYERSIAVLQANIEFNLLSSFSNIKPTNSIDQIYEKMEYFRIFWDQEFPRIGEDGACGWSHWNQMTTTQQYNRIEQVSSLNSNQASHRKKYHHDNVQPHSLGEWIKDEHSCDLSWSFKHAHEDTSPKFLDSVTLFEDIQPFIIPIETPSVKIQLLYTLLEVCGFYALNSHTSSKGHLQEFLLCQEEIDLILKPSTLSLDLQSLNSIWDWKPINFNSQSHLQPIVENILSLAIEYFPEDEYLPTHYLYVVSKRNSIAKTLQIAESFMKKFRQNIALLISYLELNFKFGFLDKVRKISKAVLTSLTANPVTDFEGNRLEELMKVFRICAEIELVMGNESKATQILISLFEYLKSGVRYHEEGNILHRSNILNQASVLLSNPRFKGGEFVYSLALLVHCLHSNTNACEIFQQATQSMECGRNRTASMEAFTFISPDSNVETPTEIHTLENIYLFYLRYIYCIQPLKKDSHFINNSNQKRRVLMDFLKKFPCNIIALNLFALNLSENKTIYEKIIIGRFLKTLQRRSRSFLPSLFQIVHEMKQGSHERARETFEKILSCRSQSSSILLWRFYIRFEIMYGNCEKVQRVCTRSLEKCPHSKKIWMDNIVHVESKESHKLIEMMNEKDIRLWNFTFC